MLDKRNEGSSNRKILKRKNTSKMNLFPCNSQEFLAVSSRNNLFFLNTPILPGSMPERLMGTDCKFVGNMSTLVQIQLGPIIR
ncbi:hypothetical protein GQ457_14G005700 [Hibiscus cannabinus]